MSQPGGLQDFLRTLDMNLSNLLIFTNINTEECTVYVVKIVIEKVNLHSHLVYLLYICNLLSDIITLYVW